MCGKGRREVSWAEWLKRRRAGKADSEGLEAGAFPHLGGAVLAAASLSCACVSGAQGLF